MQVNLESSTKIPDKPKAKFHMRINTSVLKEILDTVGSNRPETGGPLAINPETNTIEGFVFDKMARTSYATYSPDIDTLNREIIPKIWTPEGLEFDGFVHAHPGDLDKPSPGDHFYAERILRAMKSIDLLYMPIVLPKGKSRKHAEIHPYVAYIDDNDELAVLPAGLIIVESGTQQKSADLKGISEQDVDSFSRIQSAVSLERMEKSRLIAVGTGGSRAFIEEMARSGLGEVVLIDPDIVSATNIATQNVYVNEIGMPKTSAIAAAVKRINPNIVVHEIPQRLDYLNDEEIEKLIQSHLPSGKKKPTHTLLCGMTDNFETQARVNRLALKYKVPSLCAQVYREGRGMEVTFTHPKYTVACHRCVLSSRYRAIEDGEVADGESAGTPIFATTRLNATKGMIALALLHDGAGVERWQRLLERIRNRNLVQISYDPDIEKTIGLSSFSTAKAGKHEDKFVTDQTLWLEQSPDHPDKNGYPMCHDCGGTGDLANPRLGYVNTTDKIFDPFLKLDWIVDELKGKEDA